MANLAALATILTSKNSKTDDGEILGYSDADLDLWRNGWPQNPLTTFRLKATQDVRRNLRHTLMEQAGPNSTRNPPAPLG